MSAPQTAVQGPTTLSQLEDATVCLVGDGGIRTLGRWVGSVYSLDASRTDCRCRRSNFSELESCEAYATGQCILDTVAQFKRCHLLLNSGQVSAIVGAEANMKAFLRSRCSQLSMSNYRFGSLRVALTVPGLIDSEWAAHARQNLSVAINHILQSTIHKQIERHHFGDAVSSALQRHCWVCEPSIECLKLLSLRHALMKAMI